ncbi:AAA family ATPase [Chloroflexota bacterium]
MAEKSPLINPYVAGNPVTGQEMFFGREDVFDFIRQTLIGQHQDNIIVLHGQRRTGKTSVLYQMHRHIDPRYIPVLVDLQAFSMEGTATFLWEIAASICRTLLRDLDIRVERPRQEEFAPNPREFFEGMFLNQIWEAVGDRHLLLMFDESVRLEDQVLAGRLERDIFDYLRHLMQHNERLNFIFSLGSHLEEMQRDYAVLFNVALYKKISFLQPEAARQLITKPATGIFEYEDEAIDYIQEVSGRQAYYTQLICHSLFSRFAGEWSVITAEDVRAVLPEVVERGAANLKFVWDQANTIEKLILTAMAEMMKDETRPVTDHEIQQTLKAKQISLSIGEINAALKELVSREVITPAGSYQFSVDLLRLYLRESYKMEWVQDKLAEALEEMRRAGAISAVPAKRQGLVRVFAFAVSMVVVGAVLGTFLIPTSPLSIIPPAPAPVVPAVSTPTPTPTPSPTSTPTATPPTPTPPPTPTATPPTPTPPPTPTATPPTPTPTPIPPAPGVYQFERCGIPPIGGEERTRVKLCVESVEVYPEGTMKFITSWQAEIEEGLVVSGQPVAALVKGSDVGNTNMYVTDDRGNRYDFIDLGGAARDETTIPSGEKATGWYLFSPPREGARLFTFHDDDNFWAIAGIRLER